MPELRQPQRPRLQALAMVHLLLRARHSAIREALARE